MTLMEWFHTTWFYQHWLVFALPFVAFYGLVGGVLSMLAGAIKQGCPGGYADWPIYVSIYGHFALAAASIVFWVYQVWMIWH